MTDPNGIRPHLGTWVNTDEKNPGLTRFTLEETDGGVFISPQGCGIDQWGRQPVDVFAFKKGESAFYARFQHADCAADLTAYSNQGLWVLSVYMDYSHHPGRNFLWREFYVPVLEEA